jgi:16S rRNA (cytidine1402-2'-O)-methyltransferase
MGSTVSNTVGNTSQGILYLCGTPIGNLEDITLRALRILKEVDYIAAEDTRHTLKLLNHFEITKPLISYHEHNRREKGPEIIAMVQQGQKVALVSDAGMPGISDPGADLVILAQEADIPITIVPGPSAALSALVLSGLSTERFAFEGFLPRENKERSERIQMLRQEERTIILYEAPHRLVSSLNDLLEGLGSRRISIVRELTKVYEEVLPMTLEDAVEYYKERTPKGEFVLVLEGIQKSSQQKDFSQISIEDHLKGYLQAGMNKKEAVKQVAKDRAVSKSEVYPFSIGLNVSEE